MEKFFNLLTEFLHDYYHLRFRYAQFKLDLFKQKEYFLFQIKKSLNEK